MPGRQLYSPRAFASIGQYSHQNAGLINPVSSGTGSNRIPAFVTALICEPFGHLYGMVGMVTPQSRQVEASCPLPERLGPSRWRGNDASIIRVLADAAAGAGFVATDCGESDHVRLPLDHRHTSLSSTHVPI